jgi:hypothetical protein
VGATRYWLDIGTTLGSNNLGGYNPGTALTKTVGGLPTNGTTVYVRLWTLLGGVWQSDDSTYTACTGCQ